MASIDALQHAFNTGVDVHSLTASQARAAAGALRGPAGGNGRGGQEGW